MNTIINVSIFWKIQIKPSVASEYTDGEIRCMYKSVKKTKEIWFCMGALEPHTGSPTLNWEDNTSCIYFIEGKIVTPRVKQINIIAFLI